MVFPDRTVERLCAYRRELTLRLSQGQACIYSHELAAAVHSTAAQVRRDVMHIGYSGSPARGYDTNGLCQRIGEVLDCPMGQRALLVGVGRLGRALLAHFGAHHMGGHHSTVQIAIAFDVDPQRVDMVQHGVRCHHLDTLETVLRDDPIATAVLAVPQSAAQPVTNRLVRCGIRAIVNFAPVVLDAPEHVYVDQVDLAVALEKASYFATCQATGSAYEPTTSPDTESDTETSSEEAPCRTPSDQQEPTKNDTKHAERPASECSLTQSKPAASPAAVASDFRPRKGAVRRSVRRIEPITRGIARSASGSRPAVTLRTADESHRALHSVSSTTFNPATTSSSSSSSSSPGLRKGKGQ
ncbi:MAG: redox-sensing transcriptional repressor Rex [Planctomycetota bacterium]